jgi:ATP-dependent RNA helicase DeaD
MHIVVATPGRLLDHLRRGTVHLKGVSKLVLDEADQMLTMGFLEEVEFIIKKTPPTRQLMFFSATIPKGIRALTNRYMKGPVEIRIKSNKVTLEEIRQIVVETTDRHKQAALVEMIKKENPFLAIVFCRTKRRAKALNNDLIDLGFACDELHGDMTQSKREKVMKTFRDAKLQILVATDVAARGLDVEGITHIFNYDIPNDVESYIHRIGRTGRAGEKGIAVTFVAPKDRDFLSMIEKGTNQRIEKTIFKPEGRSESIEATFEREAKKKEFKKSSRDRDSDRGSNRGRSSDRSKSWDKGKGKKDFSSSNRKSNDRQEGNTSYSKDRREINTDFSKDRREGNTEYSKDRKEGNTGYSKDRRQGNSSYNKDKKNPRYGASTNKSSSKRGNR